MKRLGSSLTPFFFDYRPSMNRLDGDHESFTIWHGKTSPDVFFLSDQRYFATIDMRHNITRLYNGLKWRSSELHVYP